MEKSKSVEYNKLAKVSVFGGVFGGFYRLPVPQHLMMSVCYVTSSMDAASTIFCIFTLNLRL